MKTWKTLKLVLLSLLAVCLFSCDNPFAKIMVTFQSFLDCVESREWSIEPNFNNMNPAEFNRFKKDSAVSGWSVAMSVTKDYEFHAKNRNHADHTLYQRMDGSWYVEIACGDKFHQILDLNPGDDPFPEPLKNNSQQEESLKYLEFTTHYNKSRVTGIKGNPTAIYFPVVDSDGNIVQGMDPDVSFGPLEYVNIPATYSTISIPLLRKSESYTFEEGSHYKLVNDAILSKDGKFLHWCGKNNNLPDTVETIGERAFANSDIVSITIPDTVRQIGKEAFSSCENLESVILSSSLYAIPSGMFEDCTSLSSVRIPDNIEVIGVDAFNGCTSLKNITLPEGLLYIQERAFSGSGITELNIPANVTDIEEGAFKETYIEKITVAEGNNRFKSVDNCLLDKKNSALIRMAVNAEIPPEVTELMYNSVCLSPENKEFTLPSNIRIIHSWAFDRRDYINVTIPSGMDVSGFEKGWNNNASLTFADLPASSGQYLIRYVYDHFSVAIRQEATGDVVLPAGTYHGLKLNALEALSYDSKPARHVDTLTIPEGYESIEEHAIRCEAITSLTLPETLETMEHEAIVDCNNLKSLNIPKNVIDIAEGAIAGSALETLTVDPENKVYHSKGNCIINTTEKDLISGCKASIIPDDGSVTRIHDYAFADKPCEELDIPASIESIGDRVFDGWPNTSRIILHSRNTAHTDWWLAYSEAVPEYI